MGVARACSFSTVRLRQRRLNWAEQRVRDGEGSARQRSPRSPAGRLPEGGCRNVRWLRSRDSPFATYAVETPSRGAPSRGPGGGAGEPSAAGGRVWERTGGPKGEKRDKGQVRASCS